MGGSKWDEVLDELIKSLSESLININRKDFLEFCLENKTTRTAAEEFLKRFKKSTGKDSTYAALKKEEGNEKYKKKKYQECLDLYTESIFHAAKGDECLPLAYSNRSLVLQKLGRPSECLVDIDMAWETGYPKRKAGVLLLRKAKCLVQLGKADKALELLADGLKNSDVKEFHHLILQELEKIKDLKNEKSSTDEHKLPEPAGGENKDFVSASEHLSVYYDQARGRHVIANHDIKAGDVLFVEKPFAFILLEKGCHNCCKDTEAPIPCWNCLDVSFCSPECRDEFWNSVHSFECGFDKLFKSVGIAHLSLRIVLKASSSLVELQKLVDSISEPEYESGIVSYKSKGYDSVYNLVHNSDKYEMKDLFQYLMTALLLALYLKNCTSYFPAVAEDKDEDDLRFLTSVICRHILQLICNGHAITSVRLTDSPEELVTTVEELRIGTSIYTSASMMNHSCEPSVINSFHKDCLIVRAVREIKKGEEVFNCYGPHAKRMKKADRQEILSTQYFFDCKCQECIKKFDTQDKFTAFLCPNCKGASVPVEENSQRTICLDCGHSFEISPELLRKHNEFYFLTKKGDSLLAAGSPCSACKVFWEAWSLGEEIFTKVHKDLYYVMDKIARCYAVFGDFRRCAMFTYAAVLLVEKRFGSCSVELAEEKKKHADIITHYLCNTYSSDRLLALEGLGDYREAERIFKLFYGPEFKGLEEIKRNKEVLEMFSKYTGF